MNKKFILQCKNINLFESDLKKNHGFRTNLNKYFSLKNIFSLTQKLNKLHFLKLFI